MTWMVRLWPVWLLLMVVMLWRLWFLRARGEGNPDSSAAERRRWRVGLVALVVLLLLGVLAEAIGSRPEEGAYHPLRMDAQGRLRPASIEGRP